MILRCGKRLAHDQVRKGRSVIWWTEKDMIYLSPMIKLEYLKKIRVRWIILAIFLVAIWIVMGNPRLGEWYSRSIYPWVSGMLSRFSCLFPFSVGDCFIYGSIAGLLGYLSYAIIRRRRIGRTISHVVEYLAWVYVWFYIAWGLNYFREDFFTRTRTTYVPFSSEHFQSFLDAYTDSLNASWVPIETIDREVVKEAVQEGYRELPTRFGLTTPGTYLHPKTMLFSRLMSGVGVMGYMGPFFTEFNLNGQLLPVQYPATYAHEMAHALSISNEAEANLYSYLICTGSSVPEIRFSGYFSLLPYVLSNAYVALDKDSFEAWKKRLRPEIKDLYNEKVAYWQSLYSPLIGETQDVVYNLFLKGNKIPTGTANYSEVIALLIALEGE